MIQAGRENESDLDNLHSKIDELEACKSELLDEVDRTKAKARALLMKKELQERRLKQIVYKMESYLKSKQCECDC